MALASPIPIIRYSTSPSHAQISPFFKIFARPFLRLEFSLSPVRDTRVLVHLLRFPYFGSGKLHLFRSVCVWNVFFFFFLPLVRV